MVQQINPLQFFLLKYTDLNSKEGLISKFCFIQASKFIIQAFFQSLKSTIFICYWNTIIYSSYIHYNYYFLIQSFSNFNTLYLLMKNHIFTIFVLLCLFSIVAGRSKYRVVSAETTPSTITLGLKYTGTQDYYIKPSSPIIKDLIFTLHVFTFNDFYFKITDAKNQRFEVPQEGIFPSDPMKNYSYPLNYSLIHFEYTANPFDFKITRRFLSYITLFSTYGGDFIFSDYYLEITTQIAGPYIYGLGERFNQGLKINNGKWTIFNRDRGQVTDKGNGMQTYGYYPVYMVRQFTNRYSANLYHINYFRSSSAMDIIKHQQNSVNFLTYKVIGGIFDFRFFMSQTPELLMQKFSLYLGQSEIPPFWSFGFHQCRWGYSDVSALQKVIQGYQQNGIPLDTIWSDIDYMIDYEDFTIDQTRFPLDRMAVITAKYHYIPIIDAGIKVGNGTAYTEGKKRNVFVKNADGSELNGKVWPGKTAFVDFFHPNSTKYWGEMLDSLYNKVKFSGIWLDMNQYANFCDGPCQAPQGPSKFDYSKDLPYNPGSDSIQSHTIPLNSTHYGNRKQADVHAFSGFLETHATYSFLKNKNMRPFIITRSTTLGSNKYGYHWTGDNYASFQFLKGSVADVILNQMWGLQMVGPDICGFGGNTTEELCSRWFQLGSLYTFARNHNDHDSRSQQPYALGETVLQAARTSLKLRYSILKHYYSLFILKKGTGFMINALFFVYPDDDHNFQDSVADTQFLIGDNIMAAPILQQGTTSRIVYFTSANWFDLYTGKLYVGGQQYTISNVKLTDKVPLYLLQGTMILTQNTDNVKSTKDLNNVFTLVAAFTRDSTSNATHQYYSSLGTHISLKDYNDNVKVDTCLSSSCQYLFNLLVSTTPQNKTLTLNVNYIGASHLNQRIQLNQVKLYSDEWTIMEKLGSNVIINGNAKIIVPLGLKNTHETNSNIRIQQQ